MVSPREVAVVDADGYIDTLDPVHIVAIRTLVSKNGD
jgi:hypothetical protein